MMEDYETKAQKMVFMIRDLVENEFSTYATGLYCDDPYRDDIVVVEISRVDGVYKIDINADTDYFGELPCVEEIRKIKELEENVWVSAVDDFNENDFTEWYVRMLKKYDDFLSQREIKVEEMNDEIIELYHAIESHPNTEEARSEYEEARAIMEDLDRYCPTKSEATYRYYFD